MAASAHQKITFCVEFHLDRQQLLRLELMPWLPAIAGTLGFGLGAVYLSTTVSPGFALLFLLPVVMYRGLFRFLIELVIFPRRPVRLEITGDVLRLQMGRTPPRELPLTGIIQVCRTGNPLWWMVLHRDGTVIPLRADALNESQLAYLKGFALEAARQRRQIATP